VLCIIVCLQARSQKIQKAGSFWKKYGPFPRVAKTLYSSVCCMHSPHSLWLNMVKAQPVYPVNTDRHTYVANCISHDSYHTQLWSWLVPWWMSVKVTKWQYYYTKISLESNKWLSNNDLKLLVELLFTIAAGNWFQS